MGVNIIVPVKGMEMPGTCEDCHLGFFCSLWIEARKISGGKATARHPDCPLVEIPPHGELIEKSVIEKAINDACAECRDACIEFDGFLADCDQCIFWDVKKALVDAPTIIKADKEGEA